MMREMAIKIGYDSEAPTSKHPIPNNIQIPTSNDPNGFVSGFGHLVIGDYLGFGYWDFNACLVPAMLG
jgi:hypothetical protein